MNIVNTLTLRHLKLNKKRTWVTIIGVIIAVAMITAVAAFVSSILDMMQRSAIENTGDWHVLYKDVALPNTNPVISGKNTASAALNKDIGYAQLKGSKNENKPYLFIKSLDRQGFQTFNLNLIEGRFPENSNEVVISSHIAENGGVAYKVGDILKLDVGGRYLAGQNNSLEPNSLTQDSLGQDSSLVKPSGNDSGETFAAKSSKEYTVTGIISRPGFEPYWAPGYTVISYLDTRELAPSATVDIAVALKRVPGNLYQQSDELSKSAGIPGENIIYNRELLRYYGVISDYSLLQTLFTLAAVVIVLIMAGSVSLIYNAFAISLSERSRHLGMLASVGATKKQKRNSVFFEGFVVAVIGIPAGIILGTLGLGLTFILVQPLVKGVLTQKLVLVTSSPAILAAVLLSTITIFVSVYLPARRASKISPIEAIRQSQDIKLTGRTVKTSKLTRLIFGFEAELGLKNLKRNSRRYKATIFSLVLSIVLFLSVSSLSQLTRKSADLAAQNIPYDVSVLVTSSATAQEKKDFYQTVAKMEFADESVIEQTLQAVLKAESRLIPDQIRAALEPSNTESNNTRPNTTGPADKESNRESYSINFQIKAIDEAALQRYAREIGIDASLLEDTANPRGILVNTVDMKADKKYIRHEHFNIKPGEKLTFANVTGDTTNPFSSIFEVAALAAATPIGETALRDPSSAVLIVSEKTFAAMEARLPEKNTGTDVSMFINSSNPTQLVESINEYQKQTSLGNVYIYDVAEANRGRKQFETFMYVFFYGFVVLITAICAANIFNTVSTSISLRKREFGMLKSIGMTPEGFNKMIHYESLFYGIKALFYGLPLSFGMMYLIYTVLGNSFEFAFNVPWVSVLATVVVVFAIVSSTMLYASSKVKQENIINALKEENI